MTDNITKRQIYNIEVKTMITLIVFIFVSGGAWYTLAQNVRNNTTEIKENTLLYSKHIDDYQNLNEITIKASERIKNIEKIIGNNADDLKYLVRKADEN